ncbi:hypothetical protein [Paractinoplanes toevensis]|uniref:Uncharacterized protein n=1 Tax=Paractinoplanes toevensis TaxID=571911 RepID=A0A919T3P7_9ACTN|nr:hypothetical protein [Actinoplanes toevensis]GIM88779.1 hypothetical protein Ato02nite_005720 [Actinoplanes toevensis]
MRSSDPNFGSYFGGACDYQADDVTCGWPESAHPAQIHNHEQIMAWKPQDVEAMIGKSIVVESAEDPAFWSDPHRWAGEWTLLGAGTVASVDTYNRPILETFKVVFAEGGWAGVILGQPIRIRVEA